MTAICFKFCNQYYDRITNKDNMNFPVSLPGTIERENSIQPFHCDYK